MDSKEMDINAEYERLFGTDPKKLLFDEEEYALLRQEVEDAHVQVPTNHYKKKPTLPFLGVALPSAREYRFAKAVEVAAMKHSNLFFLKHVVDGEVVAQAAAYFEFRANAFFVIKGSYYKQNDYSSSLRRFNSYLFNGAFDDDDDILVLKSDCRIPFAGLAASMFLGERAEASEWVNKDGYTLSGKYSYFRQADTIENEKQQFLGYVPKPKSEPPADQKSTLLGKLLSALQQNRKQTPSTVPEEPQVEVLHHLFFIKRNGCDASGYFSPDDGYFYVCEGSIIPSGGQVTPARKRFLDNACEAWGDGWRVKFTAKCLSAAKAAYYVTGQNVTHTAWRDRLGRYLTNYFPRTVIMQHDHIETLNLFSN